MIAPTLLVGLGGTGSKIVCRVAHQVTEEQRKRIGFAVFDTDINELNEIRESDPYVKTIQTSTKLSVGEYLNIDTHARDEWFPVNAILNSKTLTEGAGQVRAISRLALDTSIRAGNMEPLHAAIENLYKVETEHSDQALRVIIVSSLAGGTGSGLLLPVALYIKNFLATRFQQSANIIRGFFILPEVFFEVIHGQSERNNLMCNAYATLRELDAFLMKGDGTLPDKYKKTVRMEFPRVGSSEFDEYNIRPYDFCFLFDAQNTSGRKLNDFNQYLEHAASCIYSQSIGPMNKRSNSSEDNTIRELCAQRGRNRYAGAGCSMLKYPFDDVSEYVALKWTQQTVSDQWLKFDKMYFDKQRENAKKRNEGLPVRDIDPAQDYICSIQEKAAQKDPFAQSIIDQCSIFDNNGESYMSRYDEYLRKLLEYVESRCESMNSEKQNAVNNVNDLKGGEDSWDQIVNCYKKLERYFASTKKFCESTAPTLAYTIFKAQNQNITQEKQDYQLETYLRNDQNDFLHPNAVRYFLYQTLDILSRRLISLDEEVKQASERLEKFEEIFDDPTTDTVEASDQARERHISVWAKMTGKLTDEQIVVKDELFGYVENVSKYCVLKLQCEVIREGIGYVRALSDSFKDFYQTFEGKAAMMQRRLAEITKKYNQTSGKTTRYVCASPTCMNKLVSRIPYTGSAINIDGKLADAIYSKVREYAVRDENEKTDNGRYFSDLFDNEIVGYFKDKMLQTYGPQIDMDIITAIEREVELEHGELDYGKQEQYVRQIIDNTRKMSTPFIERPMGEQRVPLSACTYNPEIEPNDDSPRAALIAKELRNYGGTPDADIDRHMIMFYQSIYGLRANKLSKFAPAQPGVHGEGSYYKAYYELVRRITPTNGNTPVITPHIDRTWHLITNMPDLDEDDQKRQETEIYRALLLGLLYGKITQKPRSESNYIYKLELQNCIPEEFIVSNHTPCDQFYEILDALSINPVVVGKIISEVETAMRKELNAKISFAESDLLKRLNKFSITEYAKKGEIAFRCKNVSIFDIPALLSISSPDSEGFDLEKATDMTRVFLDELYRYIRSMSDANSTGDIFAHFVCDQYRIFAANRSVIEPYRRMIWFIGEIKRVAHDRLIDEDLDDAADILDEIDEQAGTDSDTDALADNDEEEAEINEIAGSTAVRPTGERMISIAEHNAELEDLEKRHLSEMAQYHTQMESLQSQIRSLTQQMNAIKNSDM